MLIIKNKSEGTGNLIPRLTTEGPLCEKDEEGVSIERAKKLQKEAMEKWMRLKEKDRK